MHQITLEVGPRTLSLKKLYMSFVDIPTHILVSLLLKIVCFVAIKIQYFHPLYFLTCCWNFE